MATHEEPVVADGIVEDKDGHSVLRFERRLAHPIERVWAALTEPGQLLKWWGEAELELTVGGPFILRWLNTDEAGQRFTMHATITRLDPPHLLETSGDAHGLLRWQLRSEDAGSTVLSLSSTLDLPRELYTQTLAGWHYHLDALADHLQGRPVELADLPNRMWYRIHAAYTSQVD